MRCRWYAPLWPFEAGTGTENEKDTERDGEDGVAKSGDAVGGGNRVYSLKPTNSLKGGGVILSNSAPRRAASGMWGVLVSIGQQTSLRFHAWDKMRRDEPIVAFFFLLIGIVFMAFIVLPVACAVFILFAIIFCIAFVFDAVCM